MGLDGISINQLRTTPENNSAELNNIARANQNDFKKVIDGLSEGQKVDPDGENKHEDSEFDFSEEDEQAENEAEVVEVIKYDLSDSSKYILKLEDVTNSILILEKASMKIIQRISASELSEYVSFLSNSQGAMVNKKF